MMLHPLTLCFFFQRNVRTCFHKERGQVLSSNRISWFSGQGLVSGKLVIIYRISELRIWDLGSRQVVGIYRISENDSTSRERVERSEWVWERGEHGIIDGDGEYGEHVEGRKRRGGREKIHRFVWIPSVVNPCLLPRLMASR